MKKSLFHIIGCLGIVLFFVFSVTVSETKTPAQQQTYLNAEEYAMLDEMFRVHLNYFLSPEVITIFGLPLTAYKVGNRARYGYSNPTEWGYSLQAWIAAAEREVIPRAEAVGKLSMALTTMKELQRNPNQNYQGLFYPYYKMTHSNGSDLPSPFHDSNSWIPSGDNALLYASLLITEGWARSIGNTPLERQARSVRDNMNLQMFLFQEERRNYLAHTINSDTGELSSSKWDVFADEGGVVTWIAYLSESITFGEFRSLTVSQIRHPVTYSDKVKTYTVKECAWFNAIFTWGVRSLAAFPISSFDAPTGSISLYSKNSFVHTVEAHLAYGDRLGVDYPAFSDAMTQSDEGKVLVGRYTPPNGANEVPDYPPKHIVPHAFFVPLNAATDLGSSTRTLLISKIMQLKNDEAGYYHDSGQYPFGFEVVVSSDEDNQNYNGADEGRNIFETLSEAYIVLSLFNGLQLNDGGATFYTLAAYVRGYEGKVCQVLQYLYPLIEVLEPLIEALKDEDFWVPTKAAYALVKIGAPVVEPLIEVLKDENSDVRRRAAFALVNMYYVKSRDFD